MPGPAAGQFGKRHLRRFSRCDYHSQVRNKVFLHDKSMAFADRDTSSGHI